MSLFKRGYNPDLDPDYGRPRQPRTYLNKEIWGRVHWVHENKLCASVFFWASDNPGLVYDGHEDTGYLGDLWIESSEPLNLAVGDKVLGMVSSAQTMDRLVAEMSWHTLHMTPTDRDKFTEGWEPERRAAWEAHLRSERIRWGMNLEPGDLDCHGPAVEGVMRIARIYGEFLQNQREYRRQGFARLTPEQQAKVLGNSPHNPADSES